MRRTVPLLVLLVLLLAGAAIAPAPTWTAQPAPSPAPTAGFGRAHWCDNYVATPIAASPYLIVYHNVGGQLTALPATTGGVPGGGGGRVAWSADCELVAVTLAATGSRFAVYLRSGTGASAQFSKLADPATVPTGTAFAVAFSPANRVLALTTSASPFVWLYTTTGGVLTKLANPSSLPPGQGQGVAWSPDGSFLVSGQSNGPLLHAYSVSGTTFTAVSITDQPAQTPREMEYSPDGDTLMIGTAGAAPFHTAYTVVGGQPTTEFTPGATVGELVTDVAWSPNSAFVALAYDAGNIRVYEQTAPTTFVSVTSPTPLFSDTNSVDWSGDGCYFSAGGAQSPYLRTWSATPCAGLIPGPPQNVAAVAVNCEIVVTWDAPVTGVAPDTYNVYRSTTSGQQGTLLGSTVAPTETLTDTTPAAGTLHYYTVRGVKSGNEGPASAQASAATRGQCDRAPIFGDNGAIYGGDKTALAEAWQIPELGLSLFYGLLFVLLFIMLGFGFSKSLVGAAAGAVAGVVFSTAFGFFPVWLVFLVLALGGGLFFLFRGRN